MKIIVTASNVCSLYLSFTLKFVTYTCCIWGLLKSFDGRGPSSDPNSIILSIDHGENKIPC
jgi:hypothetical protein